MFAQQTANVAEEDFSGDGLGMVFLKETEGFILAAQEQSLKNKIYQVQRRENFRDTTA